MQRDEFERLALEHLDSVHRLAWQLAKRRDRAEDLVQEVYLRAFRPETIQRFEERLPGMSRGAGQMDAKHARADSVRSWLFTITHNTFYTMLKKQRNERVLGGGLPVEGEREAGSAPGDGTVEEGPAAPAEAERGSIPADRPPAWDLSSLDWEGVDARLKGAIQNLSDEYRQVLILWSVYEMKYREIAQMLEIPIGTVMSRLFRARKLLTEALGGADGPAAELGIRAATAPDLSGGEQP